MAFEPGYIKLLVSGEFENRIKAIDERLENCNCCPHNCHVDRTSGELGFCLSSSLPVVSSYTLHHGEEPALSGNNGAGNIFFGNCNLRCVICQNFEISQNYKVEKEHEVSCERLADIMIELQSRKAHNIGLVSPTHFSIPILKSIYLAAQKGLRLPIIYNSNGYDSVQILNLFDGIIDLYLPDIKYGSNKNGEFFSGAINYFNHSKNALKEMYRQVGEKLIYDGDIAVRGLIIRHLVLPNGLAESKNVFDFIARELNPNIHISLMSQYYPANKANDYKLLNRTIRKSEYESVVDLLDSYGIENGWVQEISSNTIYHPEFNNNREMPFKHQHRI